MMSITLVTLTFLNPATQASLVLLPWATLPVKLNALQFNDSVAILQVFSNQTQISTVVRALDHGAEVDESLTYRQNAKFLSGTHGTPRVVQLNFTTFVNHRWRPAANYAERVSLPLPVGKYVVIGTRPDKGRLLTVNPSEFRLPPLNAIGEPRFCAYVETGVEENRFAVYMIFPTKLTTLPPDALKSPILAVCEGIDVSNVLAVETFTELLARLDFQYNDTAIATARQAGRVLARRAIEARGAMRARLLMAAAAVGNLDAVAPALDALAESDQADSSYWKQPSAWRFFAASLSIVSWTDATTNLKSVSSAINRKKMLKYTLGAKNEAPKSFFLRYAGIDVEPPEPKIMVELLLPFQENNYYQKDILTYIAIAYKNPKKKPGVPGETLSSLRDYWLKRLRSMQ